MYSIIKKFNSKLFNKIQYYNKLIMYLPHDHSKHSLIF